MPDLLRFKEPLSEYNSWRVGGAAKCLYQPENIEALQYFLKKLAPEEKLFWIGLGSNLLVSDQGFEGTVILTQGALKDMIILPDHQVRLGAGVSCGTAARFCARAGLTGIEFLAGIPGTMGGATAMNAGAHGGEIWQFVTQCEVMDRQGNRHLRSAKDYQPLYRHVIRPPQEWFTAVYLKLMPGKKEKSLAKIKAFLAHRAATQPIRFPNCGSVFRNPPQDYAARLIEASGLKNFRIGGASVSALHANFIINDQSATARDIQQLIEYIQIQVKNRFNIALVQEVQTMV